MRTGVYPGTFDPITLGHMDIIRRAAHLVDRLVIGVTTNPSKSPMFTVEERLAMVRREIGRVLNGRRDALSVVAFDSLLMHFAERQGASMIMRGLRAVADFEYEYPDGGDEPAAERRDRDRLPDGRRLAAADRLPAGQGDRAFTAATSRRFVTLPSGAPARRSAKARVEPIGRTALQLSGSQSG